MRSKFIRLDQFAKATAATLAVCWAPAALTYDPLECLDNVSKVDPEISVGLATRLCAATWIPEPANCYAVISKVDTGIPRGIAIDLCAGSTNAENTVVCYLKAGEERKLNRGLATTLCGARKIVRISGLLDTGFDTVDIVFGTSFNELHRPPCLEPRGPPLV